MGIVKHSNWTYYARKKVPHELEEATAQVLGVSRPRVSWLKRTLRTKDVRDANIRAKPVLMEVDRILGQARTQLAEVPLRESLTPNEIERIGLLPVSATHS